MSSVYLALLYTETILSRHCTYVQKEKCRDNFAFL